MRFFITMLCVFVVALPLKAQMDDYPMLKKSASSIEGLVPHGWSAYFEQKGDLNKDGLDDVVFLAIKNDSLQSETNSDYWYYPAILCVAFRAKEAYQTVLQANQFIQNSYSHTDDEPFNGISINRGAFRVDFRYWSSAGTWFAGNESFIFRWQNNRFELIGSSSEFFDRGTGNGTKSSVNYSTKKRYDAEYTISSDLDKNGKWTTFEMSEPYILKQNTSKFEFKTSGNE